MSAAWGTVAPVGLRARTAGLVAAAACGALVLGGCGGGEEGIEISGSSTVAPITQLTARQGGFTVSVEAEGTGSGFERFCAGETAINNASTAIPGSGQPTDFVARCEENGVDYVELPIGLDAISVVRNQEASFVDELTREELRRIWAADSGATTWADVRSGWPQEEIGRYGRPDTSGTYASFSHAVTGEADGLREGETTDDLEELTGWIAEDPAGIGYMGVGTYLASSDEDRVRLTTVAVDGVQPSLTEAQTGAYGDLSRPLFIYVSLSALAEDEEVARFVDYYLDNASSVLPRTYFYPLDDELYPRVVERWEARTTGTMFDGDPFSGEELSDLL